MFIKVGNSWLYNTQHVKCIGIYKETPSKITVETMDGKTDEVDCHTAQSASECFKEILDTMTVKKVEPMVEQIATLQPSNIIPEDEEEEDEDDVK